MLSRLLRKRPRHPLADLRHAEGMIAAALAGKHPYDVVLTVTAWLELVAGEDALPARTMARLARVLSDAGHAPAIDLANGFFRAPTLPADDAAELWCAVHHFHAQTAACFHAALRRGVRDNDAGLLPEVPTIAARAFRAIAGQLKWLNLRYERLEPATWRDAYWMYAVAEQVGMADARVKLYADETRATTPRQELARLLAFSIASPGSLRALEVQVLDDLIAAAAPGFALGPGASPESTHWVDLAGDAPPARRVRAPEAASSLRFIDGAAAVQFLHRLGDRIEAHDVLPSDYRHAIDYSAGLTRTMINHVRHHCRIDTRMRREPRHQLESRLTVAFGLDEILDRLRLRPHLPLAFDAPAAEQWVVEDAAAGGVRASIAGKRPAWLRVGGLVALQAEATQRWLVGIVRRLQCIGANRTEVAVETLARDAMPVALLNGGARGSKLGILLGPRRPGADMLLIAGADARLADRSVVVEGGTVSIELAPVSVAHGPGYELIRCVESMRCAR